MLRKLSNVIIFLMLAFAISILFLVGTPLLMGNKLYAVLTESMAPTYPVGSIVIVELVSPEEIREQDVITYMLPSFNQMITHRVIKIDNENRVFLTKGDNNLVEDPFPVPFEYVEGRVKSSYPYLGTLVSGMRTPGGILLLLWIIVIFLVLIFLPDFLDKRKKERLAEKEKKTIGEQQAPIQTSSIVQESKADEIISYESETGANSSNFTEKVVYKANTRGKIDSKKH